MLGRSFVTGDLDDHVGAGAVAYEFARISEVAAEAEHRKTIRAVEARRKELHAKKRELLMLLGQVEGDLSTCRRHIANLQAEGPQTSLRVIQCAWTGCRGVATDTGICIQCSRKTCVQCGMCDDGATHVCRPEDCASFSAVSTGAKPCPSCSAPISKIDGCDQMWCTQCQTAFSWETGRVETGEIHNPHFNAAATTRAEGDVVCGGMVTAGDLSRALKRAQTPEVRRAVAEFHQFGLALERFVVHELRGISRRLLDTRELRVQYALGDISLSTFTARVKNQRKKRLYMAPQLDAAETAYHVVGDSLRQLATLTAPGLPYPPPLRSADRVLVILQAAAASCFLAHEQYQEMSQAFQSSGSNPTAKCGPHGAHAGPHGAHAGPHGAHAGPHGAHAGARSRAPLTLATFAARLHDQGEKISAALSTCS